MSAARWSARVDPPWDADAWRTVARAALCAAVRPEAVDWLEGGDAPLLAAPDVAGAAPTHAAPRVPRDFVELAGTVLCHRDPARLGLLYGLLWRLSHGEPQLLSNPLDPQVRHADALAREVRRDLHKMKAFVRFREVPGEPDRFIAWFEPGHRILDRVAPFFARRFTGMRWAIVTPERSAAWDGEALAFGPGGTRADAPADDAREELWRTYYASIFNPARLNPRMMRQEMPVRYWKHLPEAHLLPTLIRDAGARVQAMAERAPAPARRRVAAPERRVETPPPGSLAEVHAAVRACRACELWEPATQAVPGEGAETVRAMLIGEQPGDREDLGGRPFVGPAGQLLDRALAELGIARDTLYLTNAVKHFRFERSGKVRLHKNPALRHVQACRPWLAQELARVRPPRIACLGASAALALFGADFRLSEERGRWRTLADGTPAFATVHPAWVLRQPAGAARETAYAGFVRDLALLRDGAAGAL